MIYEVTVSREDGLWVADIQGSQLGPAATDADEFRDLDTEVRDIIAGLTDTDPHSFALAWRYLIGGRDVTSLIEILVDSEHAYAAATAARDAARGEVIRALSEVSVSQSAIGEVLGLSHQRVNQLAKAG
jgi:hypothetical protein